MAFALATGEEEIRRTFSHADEFIFRDGKVWVPVEVTVRERPFLDAWQMGSREWQENLIKKQADFYPVRAAWRTYEPVNYPGIGSQPPLPDQAQVVKNFQEEVSRLVAREIHDKEAELLTAIGKSPNNVKLMNSLGVLYARYGLESKADAEFRAAVKNREYLYSLLNLGNLRLQDNRNEEALGFYQRAAKVAPHDPLVLLGLARTNHEMQNYGLVNSEYEELKTRSPELAAQFAYLSLQGEEAVRAEEANEVGSSMIWGEER
jgi:tetratricopeptide (TPR) repeat protein